MNLANMVTRTKKEKKSSNNLLVLKPFSQITLKNFKKLVSKQRITSYFFATLFFALVVSVEEVHAESQGSRAEKPSTISTTSTVGRVMFASVQMGKGMTGISPVKLDAALNIVSRLLHFEHVPLVYSSKIADSLRKSGVEPTILVLAQEIGVTKLLFARVDRLENIIRVSLTMKTAPEFGDNREGSGFALIRHGVSKDGDNGKKISEKVFDPALLAAFERSWAVAHGDTLLFDKLETGFAARPVPTLFAGTLYFKNDTTLPAWQLFTEKIVRSYDGISAITNECIASNDVTVYDMDSRDSLFAMNGFYFAENYNLPTAAEIALLDKFGVERYIFGSVTRTKRGAEIELVMNSIVRSNLVRIDSEKGFIKEDSPLQFQEKLRTLTKKLLKSERERQMNVLLATRTANANKMDLQNQNSTKKKSSSRSKHEKTLKKQSR